MTIVIWLLVINLLAIIVSLILLYFRTYAQEKGKNLATKEDIEEITEKVETVKSDVELLLQRKISFQSERYSALIDCHRQYYVWVNVILNTSIVGDFHKADKFQELAKQKVETAFLEFLAAEAKFDIYFVGSDLLGLEVELRSKTIELSNHLNKWLVKGHTISMHLVNTEALPDSGQKMGKMHEFYAERQQIVTDYYKERQDLYTPIAALTGRFTKMIHAEVVTL
jgi:hypothetical protein